MDFRQLEAFQAVVEKGTFSAAAKSLYISQPAISARISNLEDELKVKLFERNSRQIQLTMAGRVLARYVRNILTSWQEGMEMVADLNSLKSGELKIGSSTSFGTYLLPHIIKEFNTSYPGIRISVNIRNTRVIIDQAARGDIDLGFCCAPVENGVLASEAIGTDSLVMFASGKHPLGLKRKVTPQDLENTRFIIRETGSNTRLQFDQWCKRKKLKITDVTEMNQSEAIKLAVLNNTGIAIMSDIALQDISTSSNIKILDVDGFPITRPINILLNPQRTGFLLRDTFAIFIKGKMPSFKSHAG